MRRATSLGACLALALGLLAFGISCTGGGGAGRTAVVGFGNSGNRITGAGISDELAEALANNPAIPQVTDEALAGIFTTILDDARKGNPEAALIVLLTAEEQRREEDDDG